MKNHGSTCEFAAQRRADLLRAYLRCLDKCEHINMSEIFGLVVNMPAKRFWISGARAAVVISEMERGRDLSRMRSSKREMFDEIYRRYNLMRRDAPSAPVAHLVEEIVEQPAPKFYISPFTAKILILKERKQWFREQKRKLQGC